MLKVENLFKKYKGAKDYSIKDISFFIPNGKVFAILGKNGAGKSTIIKSICGIFPFDKGKISLDKLNFSSHPELVKAKIGYSPDDHSIYEKLTGRECLNYIGSFYGLTKLQKEKRVKYLATKFDIIHSLDKKISSYSHGMKQKICLCASLIHNPKLWILDEPMLGLDPQTKQTVLKFIKSYVKDGNCVLFSSHDVYIVKQICDYAAVISNGKLIEQINIKKCPYKTVEKFEQHFLQITK